MAADTQKGKKRCEWKKEFPSETWREGQSVKGRQGERESRRRRTIEQEHQYELHFSKKKKKKHFAKKQELEKKLQEGKLATITRVPEHQKKQSDVL